MEVTLQDVAAQVVEISKRLDQFEGMEGRLTAVVKSAVAELQQQAIVHKDELHHQAKIYKEELKEDVKKAAEGYGGTLEGIERELADLNEKVDIKFRDHDLVLRNHNERITKLEKPR